MEIKKLYLDSRHSAEEMTLDPLDSWIQKKDLYLGLFPVASSILCTPASTAPVEHVFSASREVTRGKRNRFSDDNLERETLLRKNKSICFKILSNSAMHTLIMLTYSNNVASFVLVKTLS